MSSWILPELDPARLPVGNMRICRPLDERGSGAAPKNEPSTGQASTAPDKPPTAQVIAAAPVPVEDHKEEIMQGKKVAERVLDALREHGPCTVVQLAKHAHSTEGTIGMTMGTLQKSHGVVKHQPNGRKPAIYSLGATKEKVQPKQPAPKAEPTMEELVKAALKPSPRAPSQPPPPNGHAAFAINEAGELGIEKGGHKLSLDDAEFTRLRSFIERTESVWKGA